MNKLIRNPIIPGFYPDPSVCRVGEDYYLVCSSFELFPGLPVFHSKDLANWEQICNAMDDPEHFFVDANVLAGGVMAPTIRYYNGTFYIINANFCDRGNYIITSTNPADSWSEPHWLDDVPGIDASLFFDNDGQCYVMGTGDVSPKGDGTMERGIWVCRFDIENFRCVGKPWTIWNSALRNASSPEAPHLYHIGDWYYLLIAEGGTEHFHCVTVARSKSLERWFYGYEGNPILTHRHLGFSAEIDNVGHGDFIDTPNGDWYMVCLASRQIEGCHKNLGREPYIVPVRWERNWPICSPGIGKVEWEYPADSNLPWSPCPDEEGFDDFDRDKLPLYWCFWGTPKGEFWHIDKSKFFLSLKNRSMTHPLKPAKLGRYEETCETPSIIFRRQRDVNFRISARLCFYPASKNEAAGIIIMQATNHHIRLERGIDSCGNHSIRLVQATTWISGPPHIPGFTSKTTETLLAEMLYEGDTVILALCERGQCVEAYFGVDDNQLVYLGKADASLINPEIVGGMVGTMLGMYATSNGEDSTNYAAFDWFSYNPIEE